MKESFDYNRLKVAEGDIRLVNIAPGPRDAPLVCSLACASLNEHPKYEALSYVWGDPSSTLEIELNGQPFRVTENLEAALRRLRLAGKHRILWVDAICINQNDIPERNRQVAQMRDIYKTAIGVEVWLGPAAVETALVLEKIERLGQRLFEEDQDKMDPAKLRLGALQPLLAVFREELGEMSSEAIWFKGLSYILERPWWSRVWVQQEFAVAKEAYLICGASRIHWRYLDIVIVAIHYLDMDTSLKFGTYSKRNFAKQQGNVTILRSFHQDGIPLDLFKLAIAHGKLMDLGATDPRDFIFAFHGLVDDDYGFKPDYDIPAHVLSCRFVKAHIRNVKEPLRRLWILSLCQNDFGAEKDCMPTWVLNWSKQVNSFVASDLYGNQRLYSPCGLDLPPALQFSDEKISSLQAAGICIGVVADLGPRGRDLFSFDSPSPETDVLYEDCLNLIPKVRVFLKKVLKRSSCADCAVIDESVWRTLVLDRDVSLGSATAQRAGNETMKLFRVLCGLDQVPESFQLDHADQADAKRFTTGLLRALERTVRRRQIFCSKDGHLCLGPESARPDDLLCLLFGAEVPFVLRRCNDDYLLVGEVYIHGVMDGEMMGRGLAIQNFNLV